MFLLPPFIRSRDIDKLVVLRSLRCFWPALAEMLVVIDPWSRSIVEIVVYRQSGVGRLVSVAHGQLVFKEIFVSICALGGEGL